MSEVCPKCGKKMDFFHDCESFFGDNSDLANSHHEFLNSSVEKVILLAPLFGIVLDFGIPLPSSIFNSIFLTFFGSLLFGVLWKLTKSTNKSTVFSTGQLREAIFLPNMQKVNGQETFKKSRNLWGLMFLLSLVLQLIIFTPGNSSYLSNQISNEIDKETSVWLETNCPKSSLYFYNHQITCRVKTGILGITVPARVKIEPLLGTTKIRVSPF